MTTTTKPMTEADLKALVDAELLQALGLDSSKLSEQRRKALAYYYAEPEGDLSPPDIVGRSKVVSPDVRNTVESMLPQLVAKFVGGDKVVQFEPTKPGPYFQAHQIRQRGLAHPRFHAALGGRAYRAKVLQKKLDDEGAETGEVRLARPGAGRGLSSSQAGRSGHGGGGHGGAAAPSGDEARGYGEGEPVEAD